MLAKGMHLMEFESYIFSTSEGWGNSPSEASEGELPLRHSLFKFSKIKIYKSSDKGIKTGKVGRSSDLIMYPIIYLFLVKCC